MTQMNVLFLFIDLIKEMININIYLPIIFTKFITFYKNNNTTIMLIFNSLFPVI